MGRQPGFTEGSWPTDGPTGDRGRAGAGPAARLGQDHVRTAATLRPPAASAAAMPVLLAISFSHLLNDVIQSLLPAIYPILKANYALDFGQIGLLTLAFQITASLLQPLVGDVHRPAPVAVLAAGRHGRHALRAWCCWGWPGISGRCCWPPPWSGSAAACSTRKRRGWRGSPRAAGSAWRRACSRSAATSARRSARCWPRSSSSRTASAASPGSPPPR